MLYTYQQFAVSGLTTTIHMKQQDSIITKIRTQRP